MPAIPFPDPPLTDGVVALRAKRKDDAPALARGLDDPDIARWTTIRRGYSIDDALDWHRQSEDLRLAGEHLNLVVEDGAGTLLGTVGVIFTPAGSPVAELGYAVFAAARGRGVATRALLLVRDWAADALGSERVELLIDERNTASRRVAERAGFTDTGERREAPRGMSTGERTHAVYAWVRPSG